MAEAPPGDGHRAWEVDAELILSILSEANMTFWAAAGPEHEYAIRLWNPGAERIYGHKREDALGKSYLDLFVNPLERATAIEDHARIIANGEVYDWDWAADDLTADGNVRTMLTHCFPVRDPEGDGWLLAELGVDISDFNRASQKLRSVRDNEYRRQEMNLARSIGGIGQAVAEMGADGTLAAVAMAVLQAASDAVPSIAQATVLLADSQRFELEGEATLARRRSEFPFDVDGAFADVFEKDSPIYFDFNDREGPSSKYVLPSRRSSKRSFAMFPLRGIQTRQLGAIALALTTGRAFEQDERERLETLAAFAGPLVSVAQELQRTREDENRRRFAEQQETIFNSVLHTVGNEAFTLRGTTDRLQRVLEESGLVGEGLDLLRKIQAQSEQLNSSLQALRYQLEASDATESVVVQDVVNAVVNPLRNRFSTVEISVDVDESHRSLIPQIWVRHIVQNIIDNAVQILQETDGGGEVVVSSSKGTDGVISLHIEDNGPGVDETIRASLFEKGVSRRTGGTGQGLHIARDLVRSAGGDVALLPPQPGGLGGAHFRIDLPSEGIGE